MSDAAEPKRAAGAARRTSETARRGTAAVLCAALTFLVPPAASADDAQTDAAEALFRQAKALMDRGELEEACEKFAASNALEPGLGTLLFLGDCYERSGRFASALATFESAAKLALERGDDSRTHLASVRAKALGPRVPTLVIESAESLPDDLLITINGDPFEERDLNRRVPHDEGQYEIRFSAPGREPFVTTIRLKNGATSPAIVEVPRLVAVARPLAASEALSSDVEAEPSGGESQRVWAWVVGGAGVALAVASGALTAVAAGKNDDSKGNCAAANPNRCSPDGVRLRADAKSMATWATVTGIAGGVAVASGIVLYVSAPASDSNVPDSALLGVRGRF
jgi:serine/threonine-protein kinase